MADKKISQLTELTTFTGNEDIPVVSNGQNYRAKKSAFGGGGASNIAGVTGLQAALDDKASVASVAAKADAATVTAALANKADVSSLASKADASHTHVINDTTGLQAALDNKASVTSLDAKADVTALTTGLAGKADSVHTHSIANVTGLQAALDDKASVSNVSTALAAKADTTHSHVINDVTGLQAALDSKVDDSEFATFSSATSTTLAAKADVVALAGKTDLGHTHAVEDITDLDTILADKADLLHTHAYTDISNLTGLADYLRSILTLPTIQGVVTSTVNPNVDFDVNIVKTNGYSLVGCNLVCSIAEQDAGTYTETLPPEPIVSGTNVYPLTFTGASGLYSCVITVNVIDTNQTNNTPIVSITIPVSFAE